MAAGSRTAPCSTFSLFATIEIRNDFHVSRRRARIEGGASTERVGFARDLGDEKIRRLIRTTGGIDCEASDALNAGDGAVLTRVVVPGKRQRVRGEAVVEFVWRGGAGENIPRIVLPSLMSGIVAVAEFPATVAWMTCEYFHAESV